LKAATDNFALLSADDPAPVEWINHDSDIAVLLLCEHAGNEVPASLNNLGLTREQLSSHIGWDIGAGELARRLAGKIHAPLILQRYSRLLIDCNRPPGSPDSIPVTSDGTFIPANSDLTQHERLTREDEVFTPLDSALREGLAKHPRHAVFSVHSFTPRMHGVQRPWNAGFLTRRDHITGAALVRHINQLRPDLTLAVNEPYCIDDESDWFIPRYAEANGLNHCLIEVRNDQLQNSAGIDIWVNLLAAAITSLVDELADRGYS